MAKRQSNSCTALTDRTSLRVRFSEIDSMQIVWHGEYVRYFEDGRESFGKHYGLGYMDIYGQGYMAPIVDLNCQFKQSLSFGEEAIVETRYINCDAAKILFEYTIYRATDQKVVATGSTVQVFLNLNKELELVNPEFYMEWKRKCGII
ncbi:acyl-CoA thioesterase [uncultured Bacteroides sp.]|uniref:acyl-CoA thioesterase n=1 Tax=uncultured Bacteroides sp. TaxID=162156 RepID=UPI002AABB238|nr:acyl-CoA thioesterase [uncultured Bacteroides sp.]